MTTVAAAPTRPIQTPMTLVVPMRSSEAASALLRLLPVLEGDIRKAMANLPEVHFFRCVLINEGTELAIIATVDGSLEGFLDDLITSAGGLLDQLLEHATPPVPLPVSLRRAEFKQYVRANNAPAPFWYSCAPQTTAVQLLANAKNAGMDAGDSLKTPTQNTLCAILNVRSSDDAEQLRGLILNTAPLVLKAFGDVGTVHFARFLFLHNEMQFAIITAFDGTFERYSQDFVLHLGKVFDALLVHVEGGDASLIPVQEHFPQFHQIIVNSNYAPPNVWYSAYPELSVANILSQMPKA